MTSVTLDPIIMDSLTKRILELSGPMPDPVAPARYLDTLTEAARKDRLTTLLLENSRPETEPVEFWRPYGKQATLAIC